MRPPEVVRASLDQVGGKARTLARHLCAGLPVPRFVVVRADAAFDGIDATSMAMLRREIGPHPWIVRSSSPAEDVVGDVRAGRYESHRVNDIADLDDVIRRVRRSGDTDAAIPVFIQRWVEAEFAGVAFSRSPSRPWETVLEVSAVDTTAVTAGTTEPERWVRDRDRHGWGSRARCLGLRGPRLEQAQAEQVMGMVRYLEDLSAGVDRDMEWAWAADGFWVLQDRSAFVDPGTSQYFLPERFPRGVSPLGWSMLGPVIEEVAIEDPLAFLGRRDRVAGNAVVVRHNTPHLTRVAVAELFRYFPSRIIPDELVQENAALRVGWFRRVLSVPPRPAAILRTLLTEWDWCPPIHRRRWLAFVRRLDAALETAPLSDEWIRSAESRELVEAMDRSLHWTRELLRLHRWSLVHAELIWRLTSIRPGEQPAHATARVLEELRELRAGANEAALDEFLERHGHRSDGIDPFHPTWAEDPDRVRGLVDMQDEGPSVAGRRRIPVRGPIRIWRRFVLDLREEQRHHWHRVLARLRAAILEAGRRLVDRGELESPEDVFRLERDEVLDALCGSSVSQAARVRVLPRGTVRAKPERFSGGRLVLRGIGASPGCVEGVVRRIESAVDLTSVPAGAILVTRAADPAWAPAFSRLGGLVQELGGTLSHAAIAAREAGLPAVMGVRGAADRLRDGDWVEVNGQTGRVTRKEQS